MADQLYAGQIPSGSNEKARIQTYDGPAVSTLKNDWNQGHISMADYAVQLPAAKSQDAADKAKQVVAENAAANNDLKPQPSGSATATDIAAANTAPSPTSPSSPKKASSPAPITRGSSGSWAKDFDAFKDTKRQNLPFMFEVQENDPQKTWHMVLPFNPENYKMTYAPRVNVTQTQGGVFEDKIGLTPPKFSIQGIFGIVGTTLLGAAKSLEKKSLTGMELYHEMEKNLLAFNERFGTYRMDNQPQLQGEQIDPKNPPKLRFFNFCDQEYWVVQLNQFVLTKNIQRKHLYQYDIQLTGLERISSSSDISSAVEAARKAREQDQKKIDDAKAADLAAKASNWDKFMSKAQSFVTSVQGGVGTAMQTFNSIQTEVTKFKGLMTDISQSVANFKNGVTDLVHTPLDVIRTAVDTVDSIIQSSADIANLPHEFVNDMRESKRLLMSFQQQPQLFVSPITAPLQTTTDATTEEILTVPVNAAAVASGFSGMAIPEETIFDASLQTVDIVAVSQVSVTDDDTILTLANKNNVDWQQLVSLNGLEYPYLAQTLIDQYSDVLETSAASEVVVAGASYLVSAMVPNSGDIILIGSQEAATVDHVSAGTIFFAAPLVYSYAANTVITRHERQLSVLMPGDKINIPGARATNQQITLGASDYEEQLFGIDEELDNSGFMPDRGVGDISVRKGMSNLEMQLQHRLMTLRGELSELGHPEYGSLIPTFIGKPNNDIWYERIRLECVLSVKDDPRIARVDNAKLTADNTSVFFEGDVYPINQSNPEQISILLG